jgi:hypothetical protein
MVPRIRTGLMITVAEQVDWLTGMIDRLAKNGMYVSESMPVR